MHRTQFRPIFARHETFQPRFGWLRKAYLAGETGQGEDFSADDATVRLGVGKNMVRAIRFWGEACKVLEPLPTRGRSSGLVPSEFGRSILGHDGWDPYLELPGSLWLLHWAMLRPPTHLPVWWIAFNEFNAIEFQSDDLLERAVRECEAVGAAVGKGSIKKDVDCCLRMYSGGGAAKTAEFITESPFVSLGLISRTNAGSYRFMVGSKGTLAPELVAFASLDYMTRNGAQTATLTSLANDPASPGRVFKLAEDHIAEAIEQTAKKVPAISLQHPGGARQLSINGDSKALSVRLLDLYFGRAFATPRRKSRTSGLFSKADMLQVEGLD